MPSYFDTHMTVDEAKQVYRRLARQFHPDIARDDGLTMRAINEAYETFKLCKEPPVIGVAAPAPHANPMAWFAAMKQAAQAAAQASPEDLTRSARQSQAHAAAMGTPPPAEPQQASPPPPPTSPSPSPPPPSPGASPRAASVGTPAAPSTTTATPPRPRRPRVAPPPTCASAPSHPTAAQRLVEKEEKDYQEARYAPKEPRQDTRRFGDVVIFWEDHTWDRLECVAILTASHPRHEIRRNGSVVHTEPATRKWQAERKDVIERAKRLI